jgi:hypothetical protein
VAFSALVFSCFCTRCVERLTNRGDLEAAAVAANAIRRRNCKRRPRTAARLARSSLDADPAGRRMSGSARRRRRPTRTITVEHPNGGVARRATRQEAEKHTALVVQFSPDVWSSFEYATASSPCSKPKALR